MNGYEKILAVIRKIEDQLCGQTDKDRQLQYLHSGLEDIKDISRNRINREAADEQT